MRQKYFFIQATFLLAYMCQLLTRTTNPASGWALVILLLLSIKVQKARLYTPLIILASLMNVARLSFQIQSWTYYVFEVLVYLSSVVLALIIRVFQIPERYALHQLRFKETTTLVGFCSATLDNVTCDIWYPTQKQTNKAASWITDDSVYHAMYQINYVDPVTKRWIPFWLFKFCLSYLSTYRLPVHTGAPIVQKKSYNVIIFSHGLGAHSRGYSCYTNWWAKRGYIVISVQHKHDEPCIDYRRCEGDTNAKHDWVYQQRNQQIKHRKDEIANVFKFVQNGRLAEHLHEDIQVQSVTLAGHSFGGGSVIEAGASLMTESLYGKVKQYICLDPWIFPMSQQSYRCLQRPILFVNSERFVRNNPSFYQLHKKNKLLHDLNPLMAKILFRGLEHLHPSDMIFTFGTIFVLTGTVNNFGKRMFFVDVLIQIILLFQNGKTGAQILETVEKEIELKLKGHQPYLTNDDRTRWED